MASTHSPGPAHHHHHFFAPPPAVTAVTSVTTVAFTHTLSHPAAPAAPAAPHPPSPTAIAAATTLAALADARPSAHDDDDDHGGGISLTSADASMTAPDAAHPHHPHAGPLAASEPPLPVAASPMPSSGPVPATHATDHQHLFDPAPPASSSLPSADATTPHFAWSHTSSSDAFLEPLPPLHHAHLSIEDNGSFLPITSFFHRISRAKPAVPGLDLVQLPDSITRAQLQGDMLDQQGIDWTTRNTTRAHVRAKRAEYEDTILHLNHRQRAMSRIPQSDNFFRFKRNNLKHKAYFPHFQLRNVLTATSRDDIYYAHGHHVLRTDARGSVPEKTIDFSSRLSSQGAITTIASTDQVLIAGAFDGEYSIADLTSHHDTSCTFGRTSDLSLETRSRIVNHMHLCESRSASTPQAIFCSNDHHLRLLDCATNQFTHSYLYPAAVNCSATSPNGRMRVVVGDFKETLITNAETGQPFEVLAWHNEDAFACAWADDGIHVATAAQDATIAVWDARNWSRPLDTLTSQLSIPRSLRFSPVGSGPRVLVAAEADDYVNVINAHTFDSKQVFDFFGPIAGVAFTPDGQSLFVANAERRFGGIIELERTGWAEHTARYKQSEDAARDSLMTDWACDYNLSNHDRAVCSDTERARRCVDFASIVV
ncbi:hypothetical protein ACEQ8H_000689 [Pleosporales sp. CAS-2024a]